MAADSETTMPDVMREQMDLLAASFSCDLTRVVSIQNSSAINAIRFPWLNSMEQGHSLSHMGDSAAPEREQLVQRDIWYAQQLAYLLERLQSIPEGEGTVLDHTLILWCNEISVGNSHAHADMPFVLLGGGWHLRGGRYIQLPSGTSHNNLLLSLLRAFGVEDATFGLPEFCSGPLTQLD
jgi:hypothetical protein